MTEAESALRKMSWRILPLMGIGYGIAFMDRVNISFAQRSMSADLHFSATVYGLGAGLFFLSYALFEIPANLLLLRFGARRWMARIMLSWGVLACAMMFVRTPGQFYAMRLLLGLAEAGFFPGVIYYLTLWFPAAYRGRAISRFYVALPLSTVVMGAIAGSLLGLGGRLGLAGWQWLFLIEGLPAVVMGFVFLVWLPDVPARADWLSVSEKAWVAAGLAQEQDGAPAHGFGVMAALRDPVVMVFAAVNFLNLGAYYAFNLSAPVLLGQATGLDDARVGYLVALGGAAAALAMLGNGWLSDRSGERYGHLAVPLGACAAAMALLRLTHQPGLVVAAFVLASCGNAAVAAVFWLAPSERIAPARMAVSVPAINCLGIVSAFLTPYVWGVVRDMTGNYRLGLSVLPIAYGLAAVLVLAMRPRRARA